MDQTSAASPTSTQQTTTTIGDASAALALADSSLATPAPETPAASDAPAATQQAQPTDSTQVPVSTEAQVETKGEPPKWRWQDILANARETSAKEAEARARQELEQQYGWAKDIADHERDGLLTWRRAMNGDPQALAQIKASQQAMQWVKGLVAEPQQPAADPEPEPNFMLPVKDQNGNIVGHEPIHVGQRKAEHDAWRERQLFAKFEQRIAPLQQTAQTLHQREAQAEYDMSVTGVVARMKAAEPLFEKHAPDVGALIKSDQRLLRMALGDATRNIPADPEGAIEIAWGRVYRTKVLPAQQSQTEAQVLADLQRKAVAGTTNPATASATAPVNTLGNAEAALAHAKAQLGG